MQQLQRQIARVIYFTGFIYFSFIHKKITLPHCLYLTVSYQVHKHLSTLISSYSFLSSSRLDSCCPVVVFVTHLLCRLVDFPSPSHSLQYNSSAWIQNLS